MVVHLRWGKGAMQRPQVRRNPRVGGRGGGEGLVNKVVKLRLMRFTASFVKPEFHIQFFFKKIILWVMSTLTPNMLHIVWHVRGVCGVFDINSSNNFYFNPKAPPTHKLKKESGPFQRPVWGGGVGKRVHGPPPMLIELNWGIFLLWLFYASWNLGCLFFFI